LEVFFYGKPIKAGKGSFESLARSIGADKKTAIRWYSSYKYHGESAFESSKRNASYTREFKNGSWT